MSDHTTDAQQLETIAVKSTGSTGSGSRQIRQFKLVAHTRRGCDFTVAEGLDGKDAAGVFRDYLLEHVKKH